MVFSPQSAPDLELKKSDVFENIIKMEPLVHENKNISPTKLSSYFVSTFKEFEFKTKSKPNFPLKNTTSSFNKEQSSFSSQTVPVFSSITYSERNLNNPEYNLLSRQPEEFAEETYRIINYKSSSGPNLAEKFSVVFQSTSNPQRKKKPAIRPSAPLRILKTVPPVVTKVANHPSKTSHRQPVGSNRPRKTHKKKTSDIFEINASTTEFLMQTTQEERFHNKSKRRNKSSASLKPLNTDTQNRRNFRSKIQPSTSEVDLSSSLSTFKLNRTPGRWQYRTSPKPRVTIRKISNDNSNYNSSTAGDINNITQNIILDHADLESTGSQNSAVLNNVEQGNMAPIFVETLNIEISTPSNFQNTYFEIATIKTPYIFQAGVVKKTRFITVTSTIEKTVPSEPTLVQTTGGEPIIENILTASENGYTLDGSVETLSAIHFSKEIETPSLETLTETKTISLIKLKTQLLPVIRQKLNETTLLTFYQTYDITTFITATKTILSDDDNQYLATKNFKDFNALLDEAGSEINLELEFGDVDNLEELDAREIDKRLPASKQNGTNYLEKNTSNILSDEQVKPLALLNIHNPSAKFSTVITNSRPYVVTETLWESYVVPIVSGTMKNYRTLSKSVGNVEKVHFSLDTNTVFLPPVTTPQISVNPYLLPHINQFHTITSSVVYQTVTTQTNSKVLKLTFGAKTAYTTIYSTDVVPATTTMYLTTSLPLQPTAEFSPFFVPPYHPFPFVG